MPVPIAKRYVSNCLSRKMKSSIGDAGFQTYVVVPAKRDQNEVGRLQKEDRS